MSHYAGIIIVFLQQDGITNMGQSVKSSDYNDVDSTWDKSRHVVNRMGDT